MSQKIVLLHGMWSTSETLYPLNEVLTAEGFDVHAVDLPGHLPKGEMDAAAQNRLSKMGVNDYVNAVCDYINNLQGKPIVIGHSMGGLIAQLVVGKVECKALITISSAAPAGINGWCWSAIRTLGRNLFRFPLWRHLTALSLNSVRYGIANTQSSRCSRINLPKRDLRVWFGFMGNRDVVSLPQPSHSGRLSS
ncbi:alpha/beta hydrolase [Alteromonas gracilis]|uniref:alpha/beta hydrolase n=1 Tax=Alteromonas gracilis TaxID=1479524 RepID=UPI00321A6FA2